jgi:hypothetical protein
VDRCALFVDAGYLLADGSMAVHGTRHRESVSWDFGGLLQLLGNLARERSGMPLLRCYWYESTVEGRRGPEHDALADLPGLKLRLGRTRPGRRDGVDTEMHRDMMTLARNGAIADAIVVSGDEDLATVVADAQDLGMRVTVVHVAVDGNWTISRVLRQECDDLIEIGSGHLRPYVNLLTGMDTGHSPLSNGNGHSTSTASTALAALQASLHAPSAYSSPPSSSPINGSPIPSIPQLSAPASTASVVNGLSYGTSQQPSYLNPPIGNTGQQPTYTSSYTESSYTESSYPEFTETQPYAETPAPAQSYLPPQQPSQSAYPPPSSYQTSVPSTYQTSVPAPPIPATPAPQPIPQQPQPGPYTGPQQLSPLTTQQQSTPTLSDAVKAAHNEGQEFGESVARDAPALWLEAVLARKPRMPSDLEARLLQGSALPIDFLLHDEVRHALRRGFWDALERSRR